jgi:Recombination endonuclease VII
MRFNFDVTHKKCALCLELKVITAFDFVRRGQPQRRSRCKVCLEQQRKKIISRDPSGYREKNTARKRRWRERDIEGERAKGRARYHAAMADPVKAEVIRAAKRTAEQKAKSKRWREQNPDLCAYYSRRTLCRKHGITVEQFQELETNQDGLCAICKRPPDRRYLCIDHNHACCPGLFSCGKCVRGLLCVKCNRAVGGFGDDPVIIKRAAAYMERT